MSDEHGDLWDEIARALERGLSVSIAPVRTRYGKFARVSVFEGGGNCRTERMPLCTRDEFPDANETFWGQFGDIAAGMVHQLMEDSTPMLHRGGDARYET